MSEEENDTTMINPITGRKIRTSGSTFKKMSAVFAAEPKRLYDLCDKDDPHVFATTYMLLDKVLPPYDPSILGLVFYPDGQWEHTLVSGKSGRVSLECSSSKCSLFSASKVESINECYMATLDTLDTWAELPRWRLISTDDGYSFDLYFLVHAMVNQLNEIKNGNAYPVFPSNPFTKTQFSYDFLMTVLKRLKLNNIKSADVLTVFLRDPVLDRSIVDWISVFEAAGLVYLRYSEDNGFWAKKPDDMFGWTVEAVEDDGIADLQNAELLFWLLDAGRPDMTYYLSEGSGSEEEEEEEEEELEEVHDDGNDY